MAARPRKESSTASPEGDRNGTKGTHHPRARAEHTLRRLHRQDDERVIRQRAEWYRMYREGEINLEGLWKKAPLIARAVVKQQG